MQDLFSEYFEEEVVTSKCNLYVCYELIISPVYYPILWRCNMDVLKTKITSLVETPQMLCIHIFKDPMQVLHINSSAHNHKFDHIIYSTQMSATVQIQV